jgi:hypothetical protein
MGGMSMGLAYAVWEGVQNWILHRVQPGKGHRRGEGMGTFFIFGKASPKEFKEIGLKYGAETVRLVRNLGGDIRSMGMMLGGNNLFIILSFPGPKEALKAAIALSKMTGISFQTVPTVPIDVC